MLTISTNSWHYRFINHFSNKNILAIPTLCEYVRVFLGVCFKLFLIFILTLCVVIVAGSGFYGTFVIFAHPLLIFGSGGSMGPEGWLMIPVVIDWVVIMGGSAALIIWAWNDYIRYWKFFANLRNRRNIQPNTNSIVFKSKSLVSHIYEDFHKKTCTIVKFRAPDPDHPEKG